MAAAIFLLFLPLQASITAAGLSIGLCKDTFVFVCFSWGSHHCFQGITFLLSPILRKMFAVSQVPLMTSWFKGRNDKRAAVDYIYYGPWKSKENCRKE